MELKDFSMVYSKGKFKVYVLKGQMRSGSASRERESASRERECLDGQLMNHIR